MKRELYTLLLLLDLKLGDAAGAFRGLTRRDLRRALIALLVGIAAAFLVYRLNIFILSYLMSLPEIGKLVMARLFEGAFLFFFFALLLSTIFTSLAALYREDELAFLFSLPLSEGAVFAVKYLEILLRSSWALILLVGPFLAAYGAFFKVSWMLQGLLFFGLLLPTVLIAGSLGVCGALLLRWLLAPRRRRHWRRLFGWSAASLIILLILSLFLLKSPEPKGLTHVFQFLGQAKTADVSLLPHRLITLGWFAIIENRFADLQRIILTLLGLASLLVLLTFDMGKALYYRSYLAGSDKSFPSAPTSQASHFSVGRFLSWISPVYVALLRKDITDARRDPRLWPQHVLLLGLWLLWVSVLLNLPRFLDFHFPAWQLFSFYINFAFACFFAAAAAGRFVFPLISQEGKAMAILRGAPLALESILWSKFWSAFLPIFFVAGSVVAAGGWVCHIHFGLLQVALVGIFLVSFALTAFSLGLGASFARFSFDDPLRASNSPGGVLCIFLNLLLAVLVCALFAWPTYLQYRFTTMAAMFPLNAWTTLTTLMFALAIALTIFPLRLGLKALKSDLKI